MHKPWSQATRGSCQMDVWRRATRTWHGCAHILRGGGVPGGGVSARRPRCNTATMLLICCVKQHSNVAFMGDCGLESDRALSPLGVCFGTNTCHWNWLFAHHSCSKRLVLPSCIPAHHRCSSWSLQRVPRMHGCCHSPAAACVVTFSVTAPCCMHIALVPAAPNLALPKP